MPNRPGNDDRSFGTPDRERQRDVVSEPGRAASGSKNINHADTIAASTTTSRRSNRGFASMDRAKQKEIASKGGKAAHAKGTAHEFDSGEARDAGRKGGLAVSQNREHMAKIGRRGGEARGATRGAGAGIGNSGSESGGGYQNSRSAPDREVDLDRNGAKPGAKVNSQGAKSTNSSIGGETRNAAANTDQISRTDGLH